MNKKLAFMLAAMMATGALAQNSAPPLALPADTSTPPAASPAPPPPTMETPAPKKAPAKPKAKPTAKSAVTKKAAPVEAPGAPFMTNDLAVAKQNNINVRAQAHINSEIVWRLKEGDTVTVMNEVTLSKPKTDEPKRWVQIGLPEGSHAWVSSSFLANQTVNSTKLNVRSGAGENYSIIGLLHKGDSVKVVNTKGEWTEIEAPAGSYGFVAAHLLAHKEAAPPPPPVVTTAVVQNAPPVMAPPAEPQQRPPAPVVPEISIPTPAPRVITETPPIRIVEREGTVGGTVSIQAPTYFQLESLDNGKAIDYLYTTSTNLALDRWMGRRVLVSGEESLDERWPDTPVLTIQKIQVVK